MGYSGILGYGILEFILGYKLNQFWDMGYIGRFIFGYGILPSPLTKPHYHYRIGTYIIRSKWGYRIKRK